mmetsp:Transcript_38073/g.93356  ORF Transcript_38073/g.93356 Transcript_38073/m.93356 type:complete len:273 (-) Transcript_38073:27-845(-)
MCVVRFPFYFYVFIIARPCIISRISSQSPQRSSNAQLAQRRQLVGGAGAARHRAGDGWWRFVVAYLRAQIPIVEVDGAALRVPLEQHAVVAQRQLLADGVHDERVAVDVDGAVVAVAVARRDGPLEGDGGDAVDKAAAERHDVLARVELGPHLAFGNVVAHVWHAIATTVAPHVAERHVGRRGLRAHGAVGAHAEREPAGGGRRQLDPHRVALTRRRPPHAHAPRVVRQPLAVRVRHRRRRRRRDGHRGERRRHSHRRHRRRHSQRSSTVTR